MEEPLILAPAQKTPWLRRPWHDEIIEAFGASSIVNLSGPHGFGKSTTARAFAGRDFFSVARALDIEPHRYSKISDGAYVQSGQYRDLDNAWVHGEAFNLAKAVGYIFAPLGLRTDEMQDFSPEILAHGCLAVVDYHLDRLHHTSTDTLHLAWDNADRLLNQPEFCDFISAFADGLKQRKRVKLLITSLYPSTFYDTFHEFSDIPNTTVRPWRYRAMRDLFTLKDPENTIKRTQENFDALFEMYGGAPVLLKRATQRLSRYRATGLTPDVVDHLLDHWKASAVEVLAANAETVLGNAERQEQRCALALLKTIAEHGSAYPGTGMQRAGAAHLLSAGLVTERNSGKIEAVGNAVRLHFMQSTRWNDFLTMVARRSRGTERTVIFAPYLREKPRRPDTPRGRQPPILDPDIFQIT